MADKIFLSQRTNKHIIKRLQVQTIPSEIIGVGDSVETEFAGRLAFAVRPGTLTISAQDIGGTTLILTDDGFGNLLGQFTITAGVNDKIDFRETSGLEITATLTPGVYLTGVLLATEIQTQLNAVGNPNYSYTVSYANNRFTITCTPLFVITTGNNKIDFEESVGSQRTATITPGSYNVNALVTELETQMNIAGTSTYHVHFMGNGFRFISSGTGEAGIFNLLWLSGTNNVTSIGSTIGYDVSVDDTGLLSYIADYGVFDLLWSTGSNTAISAGPAIGYDLGSDDLGSLTYIANSQSGGIGIDTNRIDYRTGQIKLKFSDSILSGEDIIASYDTFVDEGIDFGVVGVPGSDSTHLNFPWSLATDGTYLYLCDGSNNTDGRIVKLDMSLNYVGEVSVATELGRPYAVMYDSVNSALYAVGIHTYRSLSVARIDPSAMTVTYYNTDVARADTNDQPMGISRGFLSNDFLVSGMMDLFNIVDTGSGFNSATVQKITGEHHSKFLGHIKHSNGDLYLLTKERSGSRLSRVNSSYVNIGDTNKLSKLSTHVFEGGDNNIYMYDNDNQVVMCYDDDLNHVENVYQSTLFMVNAGQNLVDFQEDGGVLTAAVVPGIYRDGDALAHAVEVAFNNTVGAIGTYTVTYGTTTPNVFDISVTGIATDLDLYFATMPNSGPLYSVGPSIGFLTNKNSAYSYTGDFEVGEKLEITGIYQADI